VEKPVTNLAVEQKHLQRLKEAEALLTRILTEPAERLRLDVEHYFRTYQ